MKQLRENELLKDDYTRLGGGILGEQEYGEDVSDESMSVCCIITILMGKRSARL